MKITRCQFELLTFIEKQGSTEYSLRKISDTLNISRMKVIEDVDFLIKNSFIRKSGDKLSITKNGLDVLEPFRVKRAIILAAGFGSRMAPVTLDTPKPLVSVNGKRIIETILDSLIANNITDITIVRGYKKEKFNELLKKYPFIKFVDNEIYDKTNNISSVMAVLDKIDECYICEADLMISNPDIIQKYQYSSNYLASYSLETDDWSFELIDGHTANYKKGGTYRFNAYGISYWTKDDSKKLRDDIEAIYQTEDGKNIFWERIPLDICKHNYKVEIRQCEKSDIIEIDNFYELVLLDPHYKDYKN